jgi:hypothetical protein
LAYEAIKRELIVVGNLPVANDQDDFTRAPVSVRAIMASPVGASMAEAVIAAILLGTAAEIQLTVEAAMEPAPEFHCDDIEKLKQSLAGQE